MCGITGYIGYFPASIEVINALSVLEYRGYDSAGIALSNGKKIKVEKTKGYVNTLKEMIFNDKELLSNEYFIGIGHTRWATHGKPSLKNAHPHLSCNKDIAIVHNGIIENYEELKEMLVKKGHVFTSETDSEVIAHLIEEEMKNTNELYEAVIKATEKLNGTYGLAVISTKANYIVATRSGSPIKIGLSKNGIYVSSDVNALIGRANEYISLNDRDVAILTKNECKLIIGKAEKRPINYVNQEVSKGPFPTYMLKEIYEQQNAVKMALSGKSSNGRLGLLKQSIEEGKAEKGLGDLKNISNEELAKAKKIALIGCGTSYHAALVGQYLFNKIGIESYAFLSSEAKDVINKSFDLYIFISQSGETADTIEVLRKVNSWEKTTFGICNVPGSTIAEETKGGKFTYAGPELSVASTKAFTTQLSVLYLLYLYFKAVNGYDVKDEINELQKIPEKIGNCIMQNDAKAKELSYELAKKPYIIYIGRGINYPIALEGALKMKEISYIPSIAYAGGELKHGPLALVDNNTYVIALNPDDDTKADIESNIKEIEARAGHVIKVGNNGYFNIPKTLPIFYPLLCVLPLQLIAHHTALIKGNNIDKPRNLAKSVTVK
jgi:glucosamine--fructose-6-phosphate aminotransferase (isomerizing)